MARELMQHNYSAAQTPASRVSGTEPNAQPNNGKPAVWCLMVGRLTSGVAVYSEDEHQGFICFSGASFLNKNQHPNNHNLQTASDIKN